MGHYETNATSAEGNPLRGIEAFFGEIMGAFQGGCLHTDADGRVRACDDRFAGMVGLSVADVVGASPPYPWWPPEKIAWWTAQLGPGCASAVARGKVEGDFLHAEGKQFRVVGSVSALSGGPGDAGLMWVVYDAEALGSDDRSSGGPAEEAGESRGGAGLEIALRRLFDSGIIGIIVGEGARVLDANDAFLEMIGYSREDLDHGGIDWANLTPEEWLELDASAGQTMFRTGASPVIEKQYFHRDGSRVWIRIAGATVQWHPFRWVSFVEDVTA